MVSYVEFTQGPGALRAIHGKTRICCAAQHIFYVTPRGENAYKVAISGAKPHKTMPVAQVSGGDAGFIGLLQAGSKDPAFLFGKSRFLSRFLKAVSSL
jgi:hypothetical protein